MKTKLKAIVLIATLAGTMFSFTGCTTQVDPFENLNVEFEGIAGYATTIKVDESKLPAEVSEVFSYGCGNPDKLKNGDVIELGASADEDDLKEMGIEPTVKTKEFTVSGLSEYKESIKDCDYVEAEAQIKNRVETLYKNLEQSMVLKMLCDEFDGSFYDSERSEDLNNSDYEVTYEITGEKVLYYGATEDSRQKNRFAPIFKVDIVIKMGEAAGLFKGASNKTYNITEYKSQAVRVAVDKDNKVYVCEEDGKLFNGQYYDGATLEEIEEKLLTWHELYKDGTEKLEYK